ncbi:MAG TPA: hypothetical protein VFF30_04615 [Nitrososphaerales archaeon]|nr:hypothetical protein [Nitrososphaerales archaeon]
MIATVPSVSVSWQPGVSHGTPQGFSSYNIDPNLTNTTLNGLIFDPNFIPGFLVGLPNTSITFSTGQGFAKIGYSVGPWNRTYFQVPHLAVGPQNANFQEIPRTQAFRQPSWGDYYEVKAGFLPPAVNIANYNASFQLSQPIYVGLRTDWQWYVQLSLDWQQPRLLNNSNQWAAIGLVTTEYVPQAPTKLIYTVIDFWMDSNSSSFDASSIQQSGAANYSIVRISPTSVTYHPIQLPGSLGNITMNLNLTRYTGETLRLLGFSQNSTSNPPVLSYTFLSIEGYNFQWNGTLYSFFDMSNSSAAMGSGGYHGIQYFSAPFIVLYIVLAIVSAFAITFYSLKRHSGTR